MKRILSSLLAMALMLSLSITGYAESTPGNTIENFSDIPVDAYYADSILYAKEQGWVSGVGDNKFEPHNKCTMQQLVLVTGRALYGEKDFEKIVNLAVEDGWLNILSVSHLDTNVCREYLYKTLFDAVDIPYYGASSSDMSSAATDSAVECGICLAGDNQWTLVSRSEMMYAIYKIVAERNIEFKEPSICDLMNLRVEEGYANTIYRAVNRAKKVPIEIWKTFDSQGGSIVIGLTHILEYEQTHHKVISGLFEPSTNTIYLSGYNSLVHELGHFVYYNWGFSSQANYSYNNEVNAAREILGSYAVSNQRELFAEAFEAYILDSEKAKKMENNMPYIYQVLSKFMGQYQSENN